MSAGIVALCLALVAALVAPPAAADPTTAGTLISYEKIDDPNFAIPGGGDVYALYYYSRGVGDEMVPVRATTWIPTGKAPENGYPVASWAHGTRGLGDSCAISQSVFVPNGPKYGETLKPWLQEGFILTIPEYAGIDGPGVHPYLVGRISGANTIDAVRAVRQLGEREGIAVDKKYATSGGSQGAQASLWAGTMASRYAPELDLVATTAIAPPVYIDRYLSQVGPNIPAVPVPDYVTYLSYILRGLQAADSKADVYRYVTPKGREILKAAETQCYQEMVAQTRGVGVGELLSKPLAEGDLMNFVRKYQVLPTTRLPQSGPDLPGRLRRDHPRAAHRRVRGRRPCRRSQHRLPHRVHGPRHRWQADAAVRRMGEGTARFTAMTAAADDSARLARQLADPLTPVAVRVGVTTGVFAAVADGHRDAESVAAATGTSASVVADLLAHLAQVGALGRDDDGYLPTAVSEHYVEEGIAPYMGIDNAAGTIARAWWGLEQTVRSGGPGFDSVFGRPFWDEINATPEMSASFDDYISRGVAYWAPGLIEFLSGSSRSVADVGGGNGTLLAMLLDAQPDRSGVVVELPNSADAATALLTLRGLGDRGRGIAGDFLREVPAGYDDYVLAQVLHDWPDDDAVTILHNCGAAAGETGRVLVVERAAENGQAVMGLMMANLFGARERTTDDYVALAQRAGLRLETRAPASDEFVVLDFRRAD